MVERTGTRAVTFVFGDLFGDFAYFPVWWYSRGVAKVARALAAGMRESWKNFGLGVWARNLFVPMFGQQDLSGRLISVFMRIAQILARSVAVMMILVFRLAVFLTYLILLPFIVWRVILTLAHLLSL